MSKTAMKPAKHHDATAKSGATPFSSKDIETAVLSVLRTGNLQSPQAMERVARLGEKYGARFFEDLLWGLAHLRFDAQAARRHWDRIVELRDSLSSRLHTPVDARIALVQYLLEVNRKLKNPTIIELQLFQATQASAYRDELTGLYNLRYLREHLAREIARVERYDTSVSIVLFDLDNFKALNDRYGHETGNRTLAAVGQIFATSLRKVDVAARYGGEEFVVVLSGLSKSKALIIAERLRQKVAAQSGRNGLPGVTVSGGVAAHPVDGLTSEQLLEASDQAMYLAKSQGKNRVVLHGGDRRSHVRIDTTVKGTFRTISSESHPFHGMDLSEGGLLIRVRRRIRPESLLELKLRLPGQSRLVTVVGRAVRTQARRDGSSEVGVRFISMPDDTRLQLLKLLRPGPGAVPPKGTSRGPAEPSAVGGASGEHGCAAQSQNLKAAQPRAGRRRSAAGT